MLDPAVAESTTVPLTVEFEVKDGNRAETEVVAEGLLPVVGVYTVVELARRNSEEDELKREDPAAPVDAPVKFELDVGLPVPEGMVTDPRSPEETPVGPPTDVARS